MSVTRSVTHCVQL